MKKIPFLIFSFLLLSGSLLWAQTGENETSLSVQIRPRAEYRNGVLFPHSENNDPAGFITNRARISLNYQGQNLMIKTSAQHVGVWGQDPQIDQTGRFILNEAWARINFADNFFAQLGRQALVYDDERILGGLDWNVAGRWHDALKLGFENTNNKVHLILAFNQNGENRSGTYYAPGAQPYKSMQTLWYQYTAINIPINISAIFMNIGQESGDVLTGTDVQNLQTLGTNLNYAPGDAKIGAAFYYQTGKTAAHVDVSAWMVALNLNYNFTSKWRASAGLDYLSGIKDNGTKFTAFNPLYGTHHKFYGAMDYFYASTFMNAGLMDIYAGVSFKPSTKLALSLNYHNFSITGDLSDGTENISKGLGSELDFQIDWTIMKDVKLMGGYSVMFGTKSMDVVKGGDHTQWQDWGWLSLNINPRVFFAKW